MAINDPAQDRYNPPSVSAAGNDFEPINFSETSLAEGDHTCTDT